MRVCVYVCKDEASGREGTEKGRLRVRLRGCAIDRSQTGGEKQEGKGGCGSQRRSKRERERSERWVGEAGKRRRKQDQGRPSSGAGASVIIAVSRVP